MTDAKLKDCNTDKEARRLGKRAVTEILCCKCYRHTQTLKKNSTMLKKIISLS